jgi:hypothetical protein
MTMFASAARLRKPHAVCFLVAGMAATRCRFPSSFSYLKGVPSGQFAPTMRQRGKEPLLGATTNALSLRRLLVVGAGRVCANGNGVIGAKDLVVIPQDGLPPS